MTDSPDPILALINPVPGGPDSLPPYDAFLSNLRATVGATSAAWRKAEGPTQALVDYQRHLNRAQLQMRAIGD